LVNSENKLAAQSVDIDMNHFFRYDTLKIYFFIAVKERST